MKAFVLAAGYATRMYPLTRDRPKPLLDVGGAPILDHILSRVFELDDLEEVVVVGNARFAPAFDAWARALAPPIPVRLLEDGSTCAADRLGAVGDLAFALREVPVEGDDWLVAAGDNLLAFDLRPLQRAFREAGHPLLALRRVEREAGPSRYNEVTLGDGGRVTRFREKPPDPAGDLAAIALYFFTPDVAPRVGRYLAEGGNPDAPGHFIAWLVRERPVFAAPFAGDWFDIGSLETLEEARARFGARPRPTSSTGER